MNKKLGACFFIEATVKKPDSGAMQQVVIIQCVMNIHPQNQPRKV
jgi:hypothetical protein